MDGPTGGASASKRAPRAVTSRAELSHIGLQLFLAQGFDATTVDEIAAAAGIGRRTFFRYFASKNDLPWGDFEALVEAMREHLAAVPDEVPVLDALRDAVLAFNRYPADELPYHRQRMQLLFTVPALVAHSALRYDAWRQALAEFVARRTGARPDDLGPTTVSWAMLAAALGGYNHWLAHPETELSSTLERALDELGAVFGAA